MPSIHKTKVCATCGKAEGPHWARHWKDYHPGTEVTELLPGQAPTHPLDSNWLYLISDTKVQEVFIKAANKDVLPPFQNIIQEDTSLLNLGLSEPMQQYPEANDQSQWFVQQDQIQVLEEQKEQAEDDMDYSSTPTQDLFKMAECILQAIQERLGAKQRALRDRLTYAIKISESLKERHMRSIYIPQSGYHPSMTRVLNIEQVDTSFPRVGVISFQSGTKTLITPESRQLMDNIIKEQTRVRTQTKELERAIEAVRLISLPADLTLNNCHADIKLAECHLSKRQR